MKFVKTLERGFTLVELLMASTLSLLLLTMAGVIFVNSSNMFNRSVSQVSFQSETRQAFKILKRDINNSSSIDSPIINRTSNNLLLRGSKRLRVELDRKDTTTYIKPGYQVSWDENERVNAYEIVENNGSKEYRLINSGYSVDFDAGEINFTEQPSNPIAADFTENVFIEYLISNGSLQRILRNQAIHL